MKRAYVDIRAEPHYRRDAFIAGLKAAGHEVHIGAPQAPDANTTYVCWNRYGVVHDVCTRVERAGGVCVIAENGYLAPGGLSPHSMPERDVYAIALHAHNGGGWTPDGDARRWDALNIELQPWRTDGEHILICPNRSFGTPGRIMPTDWAESVKARLQGATGREVRVRAHPGNKTPQRPLADDLEGCWAVVIWHSSAGVHALIAGIPVFYAAPNWICESAAWPLARWESPMLQGRVPDMRLQAMHKLASAQWNVDEIRAGAPFVALREAQRLAA